MTGIRATLKTGDNVIAGSEVIHYLPLSFIPPLEA